MISNSLNPISSIGSGNVRLGTLTRLRWLAICGQICTIFAVGVVFKFPMPTMACFGLVFASIVLNSVSEFRYSANSLVSDKSAALLLAFDIFQLAALLALTGGIQNPFIFLMLVPVVVSATTLPRRHTIILGALMVICVSLLIDFHLPLPWRDSEAIGLPKLYEFSLWTSLVISLLFMGIYSFQVANEARQLAAALSATELVLAREQHLSALDGLAAAAAHELGTPLSTISLVVKEMQREASSGEELKEDLQLLQTQAQRCRDILGKLTSLENDSQGPLATTRLSDLVESVVEPYQDFGVSITIERNGSSDSNVTSPNVIRSPIILYGLGNIVENAVDFASTSVKIDVSWTSDKVSVLIEDDGPGFPESIADNLGQPYVTGRRSSGVTSRFPGEDVGLGLGFFIAKTLLERSGARLTIGNRLSGHTGAQVLVEWPLAKVMA